MYKIVKSTTFNHLSKNNPRLFSKKQKQLSLEELVNNLQTKITNAKRIGLVSKKNLMIFLVPYMFLGMSIYYSFKYILTPSFSPQLDRMVFYRLTENVTSKGI